MSDEHPVLTRTVRPPDRTVVTGPGQTEVYDVWEPSAHHAGAPTRGTTLALVHGGFWRAAYDRTHLAPLAAALADDGFHVANLEFPRIGMPGGGYPGTATSVADRVAALARDERLPRRVLAVGHSAGGHLVLWLASQDAGVRPAGLAGVVALGAVADLAEAARLELSHHAVREFLGAGPDEDREAWAAADPGRLHLRVPAVLVSGARDDIVPASVPTAYETSRTPHESVTFVAVDADHFDLIDPAHAAYLTLLAHLERLRLDLR